MKLCLDYAEYELKRRGLKSCTYNFPFVGFFTLHPAHNGVGRGNLVYVVPRNLLLRYSAPYFPPNFGSIAY